jgi:hypothetical protein
MNVRKKIFVGAILLKIVLASLLMLSAAGGTTASPGVNLAAKV